MTVLREAFPNAGSAVYQTTLAGTLLAAAGTMTINSPGAGFGTAPGQWPSTADCQYRCLIGDEIITMPGGTALTRAITRTSEGGSAATYPPGQGLRAVLTGGALDRILTLRSGGSVAAATRDLTLSAGLSVAYDPSALTGTVGVEWGTTTVAVGTAAGAAGTVTRAAREDHVHAGSLILLTDAASTPPTNAELVGLAGSAAVWPGRQFVLNVAGGGSPVYHVVSAGTAGWHYQELTKAL